MLLTKLITKPKSSGITEFSKETWLGGSGWAVIIAAFQSRSLTGLFFHFLLCPECIQSMSLLGKFVGLFTVNEHVLLRLIISYSGTLASLPKQIENTWCPGAELVPRSTLSILPPLLSLYTPTRSKIGRGQVWSFFAFLPLPEGKQSSLLLTTLPLLPHSPLHLPMNGGGGHKSYWKGKKHEGENQWNDLGNERMGPSDRAVIKSSQGCKVKSWWKKYKLPIKSILTHLGPVHGS